LADMLKSWTSRKYENVVLKLKTAVQQLFPLPLEAESWYWGVGVFKNRYPTPFLDRELTDEAHFRVANAMLDGELTDEAHFKVANAILDRELTDEEHFRAANAILNRKLTDEAHLGVAHSFLDRKLTDAAFFMVMRMLPCS
jgi:hypothetical protein